MLKSSIPYPLLKKYSDVTTDEIDILVKHEYHGCNYNRIVDILMREPSIDQKMYNIKLNQWNYHNIPLDDIHYFVDNDLRYISGQLLRDMDEYDQTLYHNARLINCLNIGFTLPHTLRVYHYHDESSFGITYRELKTGDQEKIGKPIKMLKKLPWIKQIDEKVFNGFNDYLKGKYNSNVVITEVSGEEIRKWYHGRMYAPNASTLNESCMRHDRCQDYFDIYTDNPGVRMIIATKNDQLMGRAIIWDKVVWNKNYFDNTNAIVDRIYGNESTVSQIKQYCCKNKYVHKYRQSYQEPDSWVQYIDNSPVHKDKKVRMNINTEFDKYPYMDTMKFCGDGWLTNYDDVGYDKELTCTDGYNRNCLCTYCENEINDEDDMCATDDGGTACRDCVNYVESHDTYYHVDYTVYCDYDSTHIHQDDAYETEDDEYIHCDDAMNSFDDYHVHENNAVLSYVVDGDDVYVNKHNCESFFIKDVEYFWSTNMCVSTIRDFVKYVFENNKDDIEIAHVVLQNQIVEINSTVEEIVITTIRDLYKNDDNELQTND